MNAMKTHEISEKLEKRIREEVPGVVEAIVHVEPAKYSSLETSNKKLADNNKKRARGKKNRRL